MRHVPYLRNFWPFMIASVFRDFKNNQLKTSISTEIEKHKKTMDELEQFKSIMLAGFSKAVDNFPCIDSTIDLKDASIKYFGILFDTRWSEDLVKSYAEKMPDYLRQLLYSDFKENADVTSVQKHIERYIVSVLTELLSFKPTSKIGYIYEQNTSDEEDSLLEEINRIPSIDNLWLPRDLFLRGNAIKVNIAYLGDESFVRRLTDDEVNGIVDRDYKLVNGFNKYVEGANGDSSIPLNRDEIVEIVAKKFFYARIVFKFKSV